MSKLADIYRGGDLLKWSVSELKPLFGKSAQYYFDAARGVDRRPVEASRPRKSVSTEDTFDHDLSLRKDMLKALEKQSEAVHQDLLRVGLIGRTLTIKVKFADFSMVTRSMSSEGGFGQIDDFLSAMPELLTNALTKPLSVRLLGVSVSNLEAVHNASDSDQIPLL